MLIVDSPAFVRQQHGAENAPQQGILLGKARQSLDLGEQAGAERLDIVVIPADTPGLIGQHRIGLDDRRLTPLGGRAVHDVAALQFLALLLCRAPQLDRSRRRHRGGALHRDVDHRMIGIHPDPDRHAPRSLVRLDGQRRVLQTERLLKAGRFRQQVRLQAHPHLADFDQPGVVVPGVGLADQELDIAGRVDPGVQAEIAVAQRHRAGVIFGRAGPNLVVQLQRGGFGGRPPGPVRLAGAGDGDRDKPGQDAPSNRDGRSSHGLRSFPSKSGRSPAVRWAAAECHRLIFRETNPEVQRPDGGKAAASRVASGASGLRFRRRQAFFRRRTNCDNTLIARGVERDRWRSCDRLPGAEGRRLRRKTGARCR